MDRRFISNYLIVMASTLLCACSIYAEKPAPNYNNLADKKNNVPAILNTQQAQESQVNKAIEQQSNNLNSNIDPYSTPANFPDGSNTSAMPYNDGTLPPGAADQLVSGSIPNNDPNSFGIKYRNETVDPRIIEGQDVIGGNINNSNLGASPSGDIVLRPPAVSFDPNNKPVKVEQPSRANVDNTSNSAKQETMSGKTTDAKTPAPVASIKPPVTPNLSPVDTLLQEAKVSIEAGDYEKAATALERANRIQPTDAKILYDIAQIRQAQGKSTQAESFAGKAANLSTDKVLSKKIWTLLSEIRLSLGNQTGADLASKKAASF